MTRYFITGAQGFVGRYLVSHIIQSDATAEILGIGRSARQDNSFTHTVRWGSRSITAPLPEGLEGFENSRYEYAALDLAQREDITVALRAFHPDVIIHLASGLRDDPPPSLFRTNVEGTIHLLEALATANISARKVILGSTGGVYGAPQRLPLGEDAPCNPIDMYSTSKLAAEHAAGILARRYQLPVISARLFNLVGPGQDERHICGRFASQVAAIIEKLAPPVMHVESLDTTRDFIDVRDVASSLVLLGRNGKPGSIYNVASGNEWSMRAVLRLTFHGTGLEGHVSLQQKPSRIADIPRHVASVEKLRSLGFECRHSLGQSINDLVDYYRHKVRPIAELRTEDKVRFA